MTDRPHELQEPIARVIEVDGELILDDPAALAIARAIHKSACDSWIELNHDRISHFKRRAIERGLTHDDVVVMIANVDDQTGAVLAEATMPGADWQQYRDRGETPVARGLVSRDFIQAGLSIYDPAAADKLHDATSLSVVVFDHGVAEVYEA